MKQFSMFKLALPVFLLVLVTFLASAQVAPIAPVAPVAPMAPVAPLAPATSTTTGYLYKTEATLSADHSFKSFREERDPCKVFIGVYTTETGNEEGVRVTGVIDETPAKLGGIQPGDIITALDGSPIPNYQQLRIERDKHEPGNFILQVQQNGKTFAKKIVLMPRA